MNEAVDGIGISPKAWELISVEWPMWNENIERQMQSALQEGL